MSLKTTLGASASEDVPIIPYYLGVLQCSSRALGGWPGYPYIYTWYHLQYRPGGIGVLLGHSTTVLWFSGIGVHYETRRRLKIDAVQQYTQLAKQIRVSTKCSISQLFVAF